MKRRSFLWLSIAGTAALTVPHFSCDTKNQALEKTLSQPEVLSRICDEKTLKDIGHAYRKKIETEDDYNKLQHFLLSDPSGQEINKSGKIEIIRKSIISSIEKDFEKGRIIKVDGWILSITEARQCALFSLL